MSWSLQIQNGDLVLGGSGMATATGSNKLVQDLACDILEPMGTDDMHPTFGSTIDGGILPDGTYTPGVIGGPNDTTAAAYVQAEITRICNSYQLQQQARYQSDLATYGTSTLGADEVLLAVEGVQTLADQNNLLVTATLQTGTGDQPLAVPITTSGGSGS